MQEFNNKFEELLDLEDRMIEMIDPDLYINIFHRSHDDRNKRLQFIENNSKSLFFDLITMVIEDKLPIYEIENIKSERFTNTFMNIEDLDIELDITNWEKIFLLHREKILFVSDLSWNRFACKVSLLRNIRQLLEYLCNTNITKGLLKRVFSVVIIDSLRWLDNVIRTIVRNTPNIAQKCVDLGLAKEAIRKFTNLEFYDEAIEVLNLLKVKCKVVSKRKTSFKRRNPLSDTGSIRNRNSCGCEKCRSSCFTPVRVSGIQGHTGHRLRIKFGKDCEEMPELDESSD